MLTDPTLCSKTASFFKNGDLSSMRGDFAQVLRGYGLTAGATKKQDDEDGPIIEEVKNEQELKVHVNTTKTGPAGSVGKKPTPVPEPGSMEALFAEMAMKDADISIKTDKRRAEKKNPIAQMVDIMEEKPLTEAQVLEMKEIAEKSLGGDAQSEDRQKMKKLFMMFGSKNPNPEAIAQELRTSCGGSAEDTSMFMDMFSQLKTSVNPIGFGNGNSKETS
jgi:hypothetical protein